MISQLRNFIGYREYPKYDIVQSLLRLQAGPAGRGRASRAGRRDPRAGGRLLPHVRASFTRSCARNIDRTTSSSSASARRPPVLSRSSRRRACMTSEGEIVTGSYRRDESPAGALVGFAVSAGDVEGRARVVLDMADADARSRRHPGHRVHRSQLDAAVRADQRPGHRGRRPHDPRRRDRAGVRLARGGGRGGRDQADPGWPADPRERNGRVRRDPDLALAARPQACDTSTVSYAAKTSSMLRPCRRSGSCRTAIISRMRGVMMIKYLVAVGAAFQKVWATRLWPPPHHRLRRRIPCRRTRTRASPPARTRLRHRHDGCAPGPSAQVRPSRMAVQLHSAITKSDPESSSCAAKD